MSKTNKNFADLKDEIIAEIEPFLISVINRKIDAEKASFETVEQAKSFVASAGSAAMHDIASATSIEADGDLDTAIYNLENAMARLPGVWTAMTGLPVPEMPDLPPFPAAERQGMNDAIGETASALVSGGVHRVHVATALALRAWAIFVEIFDGDRRKAAIIAYRTLRPIMDAPMANNPRPDHRGDFDAHLQELFKGTVMRPRNRREN